MAQVNEVDGPSRWQQLFGKSRDGGREHGTPDALGRGNQDDDDSRPTWVDDWEREKMLVQATIDPEDADSMFSASIVTKEWEAGRSIAESNNDDESRDTLEDVRKRVRAVLNVEATAQSIKGAVNAQAANRRNILLPKAPRPSNPSASSDPARTMAVRQDLAQAKRAARAAAASATRPSPPRALVRMQNPFTRPPKPSLPPAVDTLQHINARHAIVDKKRSERKQKAATPPPAPVTRRPVDLNVLRKQTHAVQIQLEQEAERLAALETAWQQRHAAGVMLQDAFATWWSVVHLRQTTMAQATRAHAWHLQRRIWSAWRACVRHTVHAREVAAAEAAAAWQHRADLQASLHFRKSILFKVVALWTAFITRAKAAKRAAAGFEARQSRADVLLTHVLRPVDVERPLAATTIYMTSCTSPSLPSSTATSFSPVSTRRWRSAKRPPPPRRNTHKDVATSPRKLRPRAPRIPIVQAELPPRILDMRARETERKQRWEVLQAKYKEAQAAREEAARVAAAAALAEIEQQKAAVVALKQEQKREQARADAEKARRRQLDMEQWALARQHHLRAIVVFQGWRPWRQLVATSRTKAIKATHWHHDMALQQRFAAWVEFRDDCRIQARAILAARLRAASTWHAKRLLARVTFHWKSLRVPILERENAVHSLVRRGLLRRVWQVAKDLREHRRVQTDQAQAKRERNVKRRALDAWLCRVNVWQKEAAAKREKDSLWQKVHAWLAED